MTRLTSPQKYVKYSVKRSVQKYVKYSVKRSVQKYVKYSVKRSVQKYVKYSVKRSVQKYVKYSVKRSVQKFGDTENWLPNFRKGGKLWLTLNGDPKIILTAPPPQIFMAYIFKTKSPVILGLR